MEGIETVTLIEGKWYPRDDWRASLSRGHSRECPMPLLHLNTYEMRVEVVEEGNVAGGEYCWESCDITDCPAYQLMRGQKPE